MTSVVDEWQRWMDGNWPKAKPRTRDLLWALWLVAIKVGRRKERDKEPPWRKMDWNEEPMNGRCDDDR